MAIPERVKNKMKAEGLDGVNKPKRTPDHPKKWGKVMAKEGDTYKFLRFGDNNATTAGSNPKTEEGKARKKAFYDRHEKNIKRGKLSPAFWSARERW